MLVVYQETAISWSVVTGALLLLAGCGSVPKPVSSGNFSASATVPNRAVSGTPSSHVAMAKVALSQAQIVGGTSTGITVNLTQPAPEDGMDVQLSSSDPNVVALPSVLRILPGQIGATVAVATSPVGADTRVAITALYKESIAGTSLSVITATKFPFAVTVNPSTVTAVPGQSGSTSITTTIASGYDHALDLSISNVPAGVSVTLTPPVIPAPGAGSAVASIAVSTSAAPGTYSMKVKANYGPTARTAQLNLTVASSTGPGASFQGCWVKQNGKRYQGVTVSVANSGTYPFNAILYSGTTCNPNDWADQFGFGQLLEFSSGFDWTFWFSDFAGQTDMSAFWYVGNSQSQCVNYASAPDC